MEVSPRGPGGDLSVECTCLVSFSLPSSRTLVLCHACFCSAHWCFASFIGFVYSDSTGRLVCGTVLFLPSPTKASHQQFTQTPWSFSLTDSVPSPRSLQGRMPPLCPNSACGFVSGSQFLCASFLPWWVAVLCSTFPVPTLVWPAPLSPSLCSLSLPSPAPAQQPLHCVAVSGSLPWREVETEGARASPQL